MVKDFCTKITNRKRAMIKTIKAILLLSFFMVVPIDKLNAMVTSDEWSYIFHLQYKQGILAIQEGAQFPYEPVPYSSGKLRDPFTTDVCGVIINFMKKEAVRFGFNKPSAADDTHGKYFFDVKAPNFADADYVSFCEGRKASV